MSNIPTKAYILRAATIEKSVEYAKMCAESCDNVGLQWEYVDGKEGKTPDELWGEGNDFGISNYLKDMHLESANCTHGHFMIWKKIAENNECAIIMEHDAIMLHPLTVEIPDNKITVLGYKLKDYTRYDYKTAGPTKRFVEIKTHRGAHAYAITANTARLLLMELKFTGVPVCIDTKYFRRLDPKYVSSIEMTLADPSTAIGWIRYSTVRNLETGDVHDLQYLKSFSDNLDKKITTNERTETNMKKILIAVPTGKYIEPETFKSIYDLDVPEGYETEFQFFYGYRVDQIRNLIADWAKRYDYLLAVDSDIVLPKNTLRNFLAADKPIISGLYIQRIPNTHVLEVYMDTPNGGCTNIPYELIRDRGIVEIAACGFGCVLIKGEVFRAMPYPQFEYHSALNHRDTVSEDVDFAIKARKAGFTIWADSSIQCEHIGNTTFIVEDAQKKRFRELANQDLLPKDHYDYMTKLNIEPKVVYDIGACVTHWSSVARKVWPNSKYYLFEAMDGVGQIYEERGFKNYHLGVLSDESNKIVEFYQNTYHPGGNSYYRENPAVNPATLEYFNDDSKVKKNTQRLDDIITKNKWPLPDLIKIDVQGAELDVLKGANIALQYCNDIIIELQHREYNIGAPQYEIVIEYLKTKGFELISNFTRTNVDGDYHFRRFK